ncbi:MAG: NapC/NirT family cytochrome c [Thermoanaerobacteraceae bacterium]|nr:NapC/NirT family cytochrome c [Thermoanaerobacteraceae bacterium]
MEPRTGQENKTSLNLRHAGWVLPLSLLVALLVFALGASHYTSQESFCRSCHEMEQAFQTYKNSPHLVNDAGIVAECKNCHLPPGTLSMLAAKVGKLRMVVTHVLEQPEGYTWDLERGHRQRVARQSISDESCLQCHDPLKIEPVNEVQQMAHSTAIGKTACISCHRYVGHRTEKLAKKLAKEGKKI